MALIGVTKIFVLFIYSSHNYKAKQTKNNIHISLLFHKVLLLLVFCLFCHFTNFFCYFGFGAMPSSP